MQEWEEVEENQDGIGLVKLLRLVCTKKGSGPKLTMLELVLAWTDLFRLWQDGRTLEAYQREHHSRVEVLKALECMPGLEPAALKIVCDEKGLDVDAILRS